MEAVTQQFRGNSDMYVRLQHDYYFGNKKDILYYLDFRNTLLCEPSAFEPTFFKLAFLPSYHDFTQSNILTLFFSVQKRPEDKSLREGLWAWAQSSRFQVSLKNLKTENMPLSNIQSAYSRTINTLVPG